TPTATGSSSPPTCTTRGASTSRSTWSGATAAASSASPTGSRSRPSRCSRATGAAWSSARAAAPPRRASSTFSSPTGSTEPRRLAYNRPANGADHARESLTPPPPSGWGRGGLGLGGRFRIEGGLRMTLWLVAVIALAAVAIWLYNSLVGLRNQVKNAWAQIDVQLKRRHDLIPNLVGAVKGYMQHEREIFERVSE